jgi:hypothetical protein
MAYIGREPQIGNFQICDAITVVDAQAAYTMQVSSVDVSPESANHMIVSLNGVIQKPTDAYTVSGSTITFASNLVTGDVIDFIQILGNVLDLGVPSDGTVTSAKIVDANVTLAKLSATGTKDATTFLRGDNTFAEASGKFESSLLHVRDEKSSATQSGTFTSGAWQTRTLNTTATNEITGASLSSNQITLPSGTYYIDAILNAGGVNNHKAKLRNTSDSSDTILGTSEYSASDSGGPLITTHSFVKGRFTIAAEKTFELQHRCATTRSDAGYGYKSEFGVVEVYADVKIWKVA